MRRHRERSRSSALASKIAGRSHSVRRSGSMRVSKSETCAGPAMRRIISYPTTPNASCQICWRRDAGAWPKTAGESRFRRKQAGTPSASRGLSEGPSRSRVVWVPITMSVPQSVRNAASARGAQLVAKLTWHGDVLPSSQMSMASNSSAFKADRRKISNITWRSSSTPKSSDKSEQPICDTAD